MEGDWVYERTCGNERAAKDRVKELEERYEEATYRINDLIDGAFY